MEIIVFFNIILKVQFEDRRTNRNFKGMGDIIRAEIAKLEGNNEWNCSNMSKNDFFAYIYSVF